jgi:hypothetical protein
LEEVEGSNLNHSLLEEVETLRKVGSSILNGYGLPASLICICTLQAKPEFEKLPHKPHVHFECEHGTCREGLAVECLRNSIVESLMDLRNVSVALRLDFNILNPTSRDPRRIDLASRK